MTPEASEYLGKARRLLVQADTMIAVGLNDACGRTAYLAGFHVVQAFLFEHQGKIFKTHAGLQREFVRLMRDHASVVPAMRSFLSRTYNLKAIADYETGPSSEISVDRAAQALNEARQFVSVIVGLIDALPPGTRSEGATR